MSRQSEIAAEIAADVKAGSESEPWLGLSRVEVESKLASAWDTGGFDRERESRPFYLDLVSRPRLFKIQ